MSLDNALGINRKRANEFTMVKKDHVFHNLNTTQGVKVPVYPSNPPVLEGGQLYWNSTDLCLYYSTGSNTWSCVNDGVSGNICVDELCANSANISGDVYIGGNLFVVGNTNINLSFVDLSLSGNLTVENKTILNEVCANDVMISGNLTVENIITANNDLNVIGNLTVDGKTTLNEVCISNLVVSNDVYIGGNLFVSGNTFANLTLTDLYLSGNLTVDGKTTLNEVCISNLVVSNDVYIGGNLFVSGNTFANLTLTDLYLSGNLIVDGKTTLANVCVSNLVVSNDVYIGGDLYVSGNTFANLTLTDLSLSGNLIVDGKTTLANVCVANLVVSNDVYIGGDLFVVGNTNIGNLDFTDLSLSGNLTVDGKTTLANTCISNLVVSNDVYIGGDLFVVGNTNIGNISFTDLYLSGNLTVDGKTTLANTCISNLVVSNDVYIGGDLFVVGNTNIANISFTDFSLSGNLTVDGKTTLANVCVSNLVVSNDVYIGGDLYVTGNTNIANISFTDLSLSGNLTVDGKTTLANVCVSNLVVSNDVYIGGDLFVVGNTNIANLDFTDLYLSGNLTVDGETTLANTFIDGSLNVISCPYTTLMETSFPGLRIIHIEPICLMDTLKHSLIKMPMKTPRDMGGISAIVSVYQKGPGVDKFKTKSVSFNDYCARVQGTGPSLLGGERVICNPDCFSVNDTFEIVANSLDSTIELNVMAVNSLAREWRADMKVCGTNLKNIPLSTDYLLQSNLVYTDLGNTVYSLFDGVTSNAFSISCWINTRSLASPADLISTVNGAGNGTRVSLSPSRIVSLEFLDTGATQFSRISGTALSLDSWDQLIISYDGSQTGTGINIYINGIGVNSTATSTGTPTVSSNVPPRIGASPTGTRIFAGLVDEFVIYDYDLTAGEVTTIYNSGVSTIDLNVAGPTPIPVNYYRMGDGDSLSTIIDYGTDFRDGINSNVIYSTNVPTQSF